MEFDYERVESLPRLAWCVSFERGSRRARVRHGPWLAARDGWFVDGAWAGPFAGGGFPACASFAGTGGRCEGGRALLCTPTNTLERIYVARRDDRLWASSSLPFLLAQASLSLDPSYPFYRSDLWSVILGLRRCVRVLPTREGVPLRIVYHANLSVDPSLDCREEPKAPPPEWRDFGAYRRWFVDALRAILDNARDDGRAIRHESVATVSRGYDSTACAVVAAEAGCRAGVTFRTGIRYTAGGAHADDCGAEIGARLGLAMRVVERDDAWLPAPDVAAEFAAEGDGFDLKFARFEPLLGRSLLLTGNRGGTAWGRAPRRPGPWHYCRDPSGTSLSEWRRRAGFLHLAAPALAAGAERTLRRISNSPEMRPFRVGGRYDRPIPRRILEEAGVPRGSFAESKAGSFMTLCHRRRAPPLLREIAEFHERRAPSMRKSARLRLWVRYRVGHALAKLERNPLGRWYQMPGPFDFPVPGPSTSLVPWGVERLLSRYR